MNNSERSVSNCLLVKNDKLPILVLTLLNPIFIRVVTSLVVFFRNLNF